MYIRTIHSFSIFFLLYVVFNHHLVSCKDCKHFFVLAFFEFNYVMRNIIVNL